MMIKEIDKITNELFSANAWELLADSSEEMDKFWESNVDKSELQIKTYGWDEVFKSWERYMLKNCHTVEDALSFATWFHAYDGHEHKIDDPYKFLAPLYDIFDLCPVRYDAQIMDDISFGLLEAAGIKKNLWSDDYYTTETDPKMVEAVEKYRKEKSNNWL